MATNISIFKKVSEHLFNQGKQSKGPNPVSISEEDNYQVCLYRAPGGLKCAVGILIPDFKYDPSMESRSVDSLISFGFNLSLSTFKDHADLLSALQSVHDDDPSWFSTNSMKYALRSVAESFNIKNIEFLDNLSFSDR